MANKYTRKSQQALLKKPDEFVSFWMRIIVAVRPYSRPLGIGVGAFIVVFLTIWSINHFMMVSSEDATEKLGRAIQIYDAELDTAEPKADVKGADKDADKDDKKASEVPRFKTSKERAEAALAELDQLDKKYGSSGAARRGILLRAGVLYDLGRYDESAAAYGKFLDKIKSGDSQRFLAREGVALCDEARGQLDKALTLYQELGRGGGDFYRDRAMFAEARIYEKKGEKKKASEVYKEIMIKTPQTSLRDEISNRIALLSQNP